MYGSEGGSSAVICEHKDCERTDATPLYSTLRSRDGEVLETFTYHFCPEHRNLLFSLEWTPTLPPEDWFAPGFVPDVRP